MTTAYASQFNTFVPSLADSNRLLVDFSRNPKDFALNRYIQIVPVKRTIGYYLLMTLEERMRILNTNGSNFNWPDGAARPMGNNGTESFSFQQFQCQRFAYAWNLGNLAIDQAQWDISNQHIDIKAQQAMTMRTQLVQTVLTTSGNYAAAHTGTATAAGGGQWSNATNANLYIKKSIDAMVAQVLTDTGSVVKRKDLRLVINPNAAKMMSETQELVNYLKGSPYALPFVRGDLANGSEDNDVLFGLPPRYAGVELVVEDAVKVTSKKGATTASSFVQADTVAILTARPGALEGRYGGPSFSTCTLFVYEGDDLGVEVLRDASNRRTAGSVVDNIAPVMTAPITGYYLTAIQ